MITNNLSNHSKQFIAQEYYELVNSDDKRFLEIAAELNKSEQDLVKNVSDYLVSTRIYLMKSDVANLKKIENKLKRLTTQCNKEIEKISSIWKKCEDYSNDGFQADINRLFFNQPSEKMKEINDVVGNLSIDNRTIIIYILNRISPTRPLTLDKFTTSFGILGAIEKDIKRIKEKFPTSLQSFNLSRFLECWEKNAAYISRILDIDTQTELLWFAYLVKESSVNLKIEFLHNIIGVITTAQERFEFVEKYGKFSLDERADILTQVYNFKERYDLNPTDIYLFTSFVILTKKDQRIAILSMISDCFTQGQSVDGMRPLLKSWKKILPSDMKVVIKSIVEFCENDITILEGVSSILVEESAEAGRDLLEMIKPLCKNQRYSDQLAILSSVAYVPVHHRIRLVNTLMGRDVMSASLGDILDVIKDIPKNEVVDLLNKAICYVKKDHSKINISDLLKAAFYFPCAYFDQIMDRFPKANNTLGSPEDIIAWAVVFNIEIKDAIYAHLHERLVNLSNQKHAQSLAQLIFDNQVRFLLPEDHSLCDEVETILTLVGRHRNPYNIFDQLEKLAKTPCLEVHPPKEMIGKERLSLKTSSFLNNTSRRDITFRDLPADINQTSFENLFEKITRRIEELDAEKKKKTLDYINLTKHGVLLGSTSEPITDVLSKLQTNFINDRYIQSLLVKTDPQDIVPLTQVRFYTILKFVMDQSDDVKTNDLLSLREEALLNISASIQKCPGGKSEGIADVYEWLLKDEKIVSLKHDAEQSSLDRRFHGKKLIDQIINRSLTAIFSDSAFIKTLSRDSHIFKQLAHQSIFLKNILASQVGLVHDVQFDLYSGYIHRDLLDVELSQSRLKLLTKFYQFFTPKFLVNALVKDSIQQASKDLMVIVDKYRKSSSQEEKRIRGNDTAEENESVKGSGKYFTYLFDYFQATRKDNAHDSSIVLWENLNIEKDLHLNPNTLCLDAETLDMLMPSKLTVEGARELLKSAGYLNCIEI